MTDRQFCSYAVYIFVHVYYVKLILSDTNGFNIFLLYTKYIQFFVLTSTD